MAEKTKKQGPVEFNKNPKYGDVERMAMAASRKMTFEQSGVKDTPQNRKDWDDLVKDFEEMERDGVMPDIPYA
ncbi:MAG: hypothetical protein ACO3CH_00465 [Ilumatobacteraceae bacterium]|nr:hypothetical protein [Chitinophagales bacterium]